MNIDYEELNSLLFPNDSISENEGFENYLSYLASCGLDKLLREGNHLKEERNLVLNDTRNFVYKNYKTFIRTAECTKIIYNEFNDIESNLKSVITSFPKLKDKVDEFSSTSSHLSEARCTTQMTLKKHSELMEILEIPQLMETCVRNGHYDDALEILQYVKRLEKKNLDIPILTSIINDVKNGTRLMLLQLLLQLRSSLSLPQCLKTVGYVQRLGLFSEAELRLKYLQARNSWFSALLKNIPNEDPFFHISKVIELYRQHVFDILTHYRAIFSDDQIKMGVGEFEVNDQIIFNGWIVYKINQFIKMLEKDLKRGVGSNMESVLDQCMFFGLSFSRIGVDFRGQLLSVFQNAILANFGSDVQSANFKFDESFSSFSLVDSAPLQASSLVLESQDKTNPPLCLMEYPPLASYMNGLVKAFNGLRQCCVLSLLADVLETLKLSIAKIITALLDMHQMDSVGFTANEVKSFSRMCFVIVDSLIPHINTCLSLLFPVEEIAKITGISAIELKKRNTGQLDVSSLTGRIEEFLPAKPLFQLGGEKDESEGWQRSTEASEPEGPRENDVVGSDQVAVTEEPAQGDCHFDAARQSRDAEVSEALPMSADVIDQAPNATQQS